MKRIFLLPQALLWGSAFFFWGCSAQTDSQATPGGSTGGAPWLIPQEEVFSGGPGKDGIPSIDQPRFRAADETDYLSPDDLVVGVSAGGEFRAYPHPILDWHEIVNDDLDGLKLALTYCPLTGTAIGWDRRINGKETTSAYRGYCTIPTWTPTTFLNPT